MFSEKRCLFKNNFVYLLKILEGMMVVKTLAKIVSCIFFVVHSLIPFCLLFSNLFGFSFSLTNYTAFSVICVIVSIFTLVVVLVETELFNDKKYSVLFGVSLLFCVVTWLFFISKCGVSLSLVFLLIAFACVAVINVKLTKGKKKKVVLSLLTAVSFLFVSLFAIAFVFVGSIGASTVLDTIQSPDGIYYAEVIDVDQGAFGGNTVVKVSKKREAEILIFHFQEKGETVYIGEWNEYDDMEIFWKENNCLSINSEEYIIK